MSLSPQIPRRDIVGRRCVTVNCNRNDINGEPLNMGRGVIRASSHADPSVQDEKVLVEFDSSSDWTGRQWVSIHSQFDVLLVEDTLVGVVPDGGASGIYQPVLTFKTVVDRINYSSSNQVHLVESLMPDRMLNFVPDSSIVHLKEDDVRRICDSQATNDWAYARSWLSFQQVQHVLLSNPSRLINRRVRVYNIESNSQWYSGRIIAANENTKSVTILDDGGIEHMENAALVQMELDSRDFNISKSSSSNISKPRGRISTEEHPMVKQPKLDIPASGVDFPLQSPSSLSHGPARQLLTAMAGGASECNSNTIRPLQVDTSSSRNLFSAMMTPSHNHVESQPNGAPVVYAITTNPLQVSKAGSLVMPASAAAPLLSTSRSLPGNADASKIKTLLGYRPSVMFVIPTPGPVSPSGKSSAAPMPGSYPSTAQTLGSSGSQRGSDESTGSDGPIQKSPVYQLPAGVEYIGTIPIQIRNPPQSPRYFMPEITASAKLHGQRSSSDSLDGGKQPCGQPLLGFQSSECPVSKAQMQGPVRMPAVAPGGPISNQPIMSSGVALGVGNTTGLQNRVRLPGVPRTGFVQHLEGNAVGPSGMQGIQGTGEVPQMLSPNRLQHLGRMPVGVQTVSAVQQIQSSTTVAGMQGVTGVPHMQSPSRVPGLQTTGAVQPMHSQSGMPGVQTATGVQQVQSPSRMAGVQSVAGLLQMQGTSRMLGVQSATGVQQVQSPSRMPGVQSATGVQQVQSASRMPGVQSAIGEQHIQSPSRMPVVQSATGVQQVQSASRMPGVQSATGVQQIQSPSRMLGIQSVSGVQPIQSPGGMQRVQTTSEVHQMQSQMRMSGVQNVSVNQHQPPVRIRGSNENQPSSVRAQGMQGCTGIQQMPNPAQFQGVPSTSGDEQRSLQFQRVQAARARHPRGQIRSNAGGFQRMPNSGARPPGQFTTRRMPAPTGFQTVQVQEEAELVQKTNSAQHGRWSNSPTVRQAQSSPARFPLAPSMRGMQRRADFRGQASSSLHGSRKQTGFLRPDDASSMRQSLVGASSQEIVQQVVENALRKYGLEMNCRMKPATQRLDAVGCTKTNVSSLNLPVGGSGGLSRGSVSQATAQEGGGALDRVNYDHHISTAEPSTSNSAEVSKGLDSDSSLKPNMTCEAKQVVISCSSSLVGNTSSSVAAPGSQTHRARPASKVSKSHCVYYDTKSDSRPVSIEIIKGNGRASQLNRNRSINAKRRTPPQPASDSSRTTSSDLLPMSESEVPTQDLKAVVASCKLEGAAKSVSSTNAGVNCDLRQTGLSHAVARVGGGKARMWFEEYEDELQDLSRILDMLKRLDGSKCHRAEDSTGGNKMPEPKLLSNQTNNLQIAKPDTSRRPKNRHNAVKTSQQKSDCERKVKQLQAQLHALGLKFDNPSYALSKKKLNSVCSSSNGLRTCIQDKSCLSLPPPLVKCRECKFVSSCTSKLSQVLCRFHAFRRLTLTDKGAYVGGGFSSPTDADAVEISLWMPLLPIVHPQIDVEMAKYIIKNVGNRFCELVEQEKEAMSWIASNGDVAWKRAMNGVREMCDVCNTTLFNVHWVCRKCGYVVCLDCYRTKTHKCTRCHEDVNCATCDRGFLKWAKCSVNRQPHDPKEMMLTQIIPSDVLWVVGRMIHDIRKTWHISENCPCGEDRIFDLAEEPRTLEQVNCVTQSDDKVSVPDGKHCEGLDSGLTETHGHDTDSKKELKEELSLDRKTGSEVELQSADKTVVKSNSRTAVGQGPPTLREFLLEKNSAFNGLKLETPTVSSSQNLDDIFRRVMKEKLSNVVSNVSPRPTQNSSLATNDVTSTPEGPISSSPQEVAHAWLDNGRLLQLLEPRNPHNIKMFQEVWRKGKPVLISNCDQYITKDLWLPEAFAKEFGDMENDLVDCSHKVVLIGHQMRHFWQGFESVKARLRDSEDNPMILKLKDWPPMEDFSEMLPTRFKDLLQGLPLPEYTHRSGVFNLASRLPEFFVRPDLGPKMYNAYGSALHPMVGSTNLHLDVSDAVNLILYVGVPMDDTEDHEAAAIEGMKKAGCCELTMARTAEHGQKPGALWHIFDAKDSDKIRDMLTKVGMEIGEPVEAHHDPIHDQSWYLDEMLRERLLREYSVQGYTLVQCVGDAIFIPAGAPHQVRNLHSCIKAAEDFVSPENLSHCFKMTQEFRHLSDTHSNHEDKLQVKNIIYHAVKDAIAVLQNNTPDSA